MGKSLVSCFFFETQCSTNKVKKNLIKVKKTIDYKFTFAYGRWLILVHTAGSAVKRSRVGLYDELWLQEGLVDIPDSSASPRSRSADWYRRWPNDMPDNSPRWRRDLLTAEFPITYYVTATSITTTLLVHGLVNFISVINFTCIHWEAKCTIKLKNTFIMFFCVFQTHIIMMTTLSWSVMVIFIRPLCQWLRMAAKQCPWVV